MSHIHSSTTTTATYVHEAKSQNEQNENSPTIVKILKLAPQKVVRWDENTIDNENMKKKSSKICCIYHKPREFGESSDSDSDSNSDADDDSLDADGNCNSCSKEANHNNGMNAKMGN